ncbi:hypothetical protein XBO1_1630002 [Xenorhabdus bovienii str. oregonense]|uniref:Ner winged helix-turn-helix DNA-binding domain-containing protein n=1 Tax=Xenorhabdus bovienii str. oregonense TaxID=1398202 RepID=A0A077P596_XENBV|nr:hypothetical protein XBO1_1630002 [Xenorhabdus bovienii str. oregonense]
MECKVYITNNNYWKYIFINHIHDEWIIANQLEINPSQIWPSRYLDNEGNLIERNPRKKLAQETKIVM